MNNNKKIKRQDIKVDAKIAKKGFEQPGPGHEGIAGHYFLQANVFQRTLQ